ncbi:MAG: bifunctional diguanylate cyclase/phosphodiesterase [Cyanobacteria bacterium J06573_11]
MLKASDMNQQAAKIIPDSLPDQMALAASSTLPREESVGLQLNSPELWQVRPMSLDHPIVSVGLVLGSLSLMLVLLWLRVCRLTALIRRRDQRIKVLAQGEALTGLANRKTFCRQGEKLLKKNPSATVSLLSLDINGFKLINDGLGHAAGDALLQQLGQRLLSCIGPRDMVARTGGDEFSILINSGDLTRTQSMVDAVLAALNQPFQIQSREIYIQGRIGVALNQAMAGSREASPGAFSRLLARASIAMAQTKAHALPSLPLSLSPQPLLSPSEQSPVQSFTQGTLSAQPKRKAGDSQVAFFHPEMAERRRDRVLRQQALSHAIEGNELRVHYQAIVDLNTSKTVGFEALVRWQHPTRGLLFPVDFLPLAEELGLIVEIDRWVMAQACQQLLVWEAIGLQPSVSVNLSGVHLSQPDLVDYVQSVLEDYPVDPRQLNLEVTESVMISHPEQVIETLHRLRDMGLKVSLDDFGTGYSSLGYLQQLPVDILKIDQSFVQCLGQSTKPEPLSLNSPSAQQQMLERQDIVILRSILSLAKGLGLRVVAEGIERDDQLDLLKQLDCCYGQGHLFSKSVSGPSASDLLFL